MKKKIEKQLVFFSDFEGKIAAGSSELHCTYMEEHLMKKIGVF